MGQSGSREAEQRGVKNLPQHLDASSGLKGRSRDPLPRAKVQVWALEHDIGRSTGHALWRRHALGLNLSCDDLQDGAVGQLIGLP